MTTLPIKLRLANKWLLVRAAGWGLIFRILESSGFIRKAIHSKHNNFKPIILGDKTLWIVSSVLQPKMKPFSYSKIRSVFDHDLRFFQTKETISSIKSASAQVVIAIVEGSTYSRIHELADKDTVVFQLKSKILRFVVNGPFKGLGEAILLLIIHAEANPTTYIKKISGRYIVNQAIEKRPILFREQSGSAISISYGMSFDVFECWQNYLELHLSDLSRGISMEQVLHNFTQDYSFTGSPILGVSGRTAVTGGEIHV